MRPVALLLAALLAAPSVPLSADAGAPLSGFSAAGTAEQRALEARFDALLKADDLREWARRMSARPHHLGSPGGRANAEFALEQFRAWGFEARIDEYQVLFPTPRVRRVELLAPRRFAAKLQEPAVAGDATSGQHAEQLPTYNAYSIDGDVTGELVFVNRGIPADYEELERRGIDVRGKIVIARYGGSWRGIKPKVAAERGALACLIYSDPADDGYLAGEEYPKGGYRPADGVQRGSVADMPLYPGDPLTPGIGATADAKRLPREQAPTLTRIPVLPISWADAKPLLAALAGPVAPQPWRGGLPITYRLGPGPAEVRVQLAFDWKLVPALNVIAVMKGAERPDEWVLRGNHRDAWVNGAADPVSGAVALMGEARAIGELARAGFRPKRTLVYALWDGEEQGLLGSVEWAEHHAAELQAKAVAYVNTDSNSRGALGMGGSHSLQRLMNEIAGDVRDPKHAVPVAERLRAFDLVGADPAERQRALDRAELPLEALGSGSDYTPFLQHLGIAALNLGFGGEGHYGQYHSVYDSFDHYVRFMDPDFAYGVALAQVAGRATLRLAQAELLPFRGQALADTVAGYVDEVEALATRMRRDTAARNRAIAAGAFAVAAPPDETRVAPKPRPEVPHFNFAPLRNAVERLRGAARAWDEAAARGTGAAPAARAKADALLIRLERALTRDEGLPGRPWFRHHVYAPGFYTGYGVKTLPGVREAIEERRDDAVEREVVRAAEVLVACAARLEEAARALAE
ncbi:MAG: M28 family peptidase [Vicinamibacteria bacterium]|nr:M28 family peptidase [Vicinamibacteria bacterium]